MLHALHNIQAFALHEPLPADVRQKLVEIATVQSAKMEEELRVGGGGGGRAGGGGGGGGAAMGLQLDMISGLVLLTHAAVCCRMLPYAAVCLRMLTDGRTCTRADVQRERTAGSG